MTFPLRSLSAVVLTLVVCLHPSAEAADDFRREMTIVNNAPGRVLQRLVQSDTEALDERELDLKPCDKTTETLFRMTGATIQFHLPAGENGDWCLFRGVDLGPAHGLAVGMTGPGCRRPVLAVLDEDGGVIALYAGVAMREYDDSFHRDGGLEGMAYRERAEAKVRKGTLKF